MQSNFELSTRNDEISDEFEKIPSLILAHQENFEKRIEKHIGEMKRDFGQRMMKDRELRAREIREMKKTLASLDHTMRNVKLNLTRANEKKLGVS